MQSWFHVDSKAVFKFEGATEEIVKEIILTKGMVHNVIYYLGVSLLLHRRSLHEYLYCYCHALLDSLFDAFGFIQTDLKPLTNSSIYK